MLTALIFKDFDGNSIDVLNNELSYEFMRNKFKVIYSAKGEEVYLGKFYINKVLIGGVSIAFNSL